MQDKSISQSSHSSSEDSHSTSEDGDEEELSHSSNGRAIRALNHTVSRLESVISAHENRIESLKQEIKAVTSESARRIGGEV